jgi:hypothetical protein
MQKEISSIPQPFRVEAIVEALVITVEKLRNKVKVIEAVGDE